jgi:hypothetical protein
MTDPPSESPDPAEPRVADLLALVGSRTPSLSETFTPELVARARRQQAIAVPLRMLGAFVAALAAAVGAAVGAGPKDPQP